MDNYKNGKKILYAQFCIFFGLMFMARWIVDVNANL